MNDLMSDIFGAYAKQDLIDSLAGDPEQWKFVDYNLKNYYGRLVFKTKKWKLVHKELFNNGEIKNSDDFIGGGKDYSGGSVFGYALPMFILWYFDYCGRFVKESIEDFYSETRPKAYTLAHARMRIWRSTLQIIHWPPEHGMFGTATESIVELLWGKPGVGTSFDKHLVGPLPLEMYPSNIIGMYWSSVINRLLGAKKGILVGDYMRGHAIHAVEDINSASLPKMETPLKEKMESVCRLWKEGYEIFIDNEGPDNKNGREIFLNAEKQIIDDIESKVWPAFMSDVLEACLSKAGRI